MKSPSGALPSITAIINPSHQGKPLDGVGAVFSREHVTEANVRTITSARDYADILYRDGNPVAHLQVDFAA